MNDAGWPTRILRVCASLKLAVTQSVFGTRNMSCVPAVTYWPRRTPISLSWPACGARITVWSRSTSASRTCALAASTLALRPARPTMTVRTSCRPISRAACASLSWASAARSAATCWSRSRLVTQPWAISASTRRVSAWTLSELRLGVGDGGILGQLIGLLRPLRLGRIVEVRDLGQDIGARLSDLGAVNPVLDADEDLRRP